MKFAWNTSLYTISVVFPIFFFFTHTIRYGGSQTLLIWRKVTGHSWRNYRYSKFTIFFHPSTKKISNFIMEISRPVMGVPWAVQIKLGCPSTTDTRTWALANVYTHFWSAVSRYVTYAALSWGHCHCYSGFIKKSVKMKPVVCVQLSNKFPGCSPTVLQSYSRQQRWAIKPWSWNSER